MLPPESIETSRLLLRRPAPEDAEAIFEGYAHDPQVTRYLTWQPHHDVGETRDFLEGCLKGWEHGTAFPWVITLRGGKATLGMFELRIDRYRADFGYVIAREYWGRGYASECTTAVTRWAIGQESIYRVWAVCDVENLASKRVLEKAGMQEEGILRRYLIHPGVSREPRDCYCFALVK